MLQLSQWRLPEMGKMTCKGSIWRRSSCFLLLLMYNIYECDAQSLESGPLFLAVPPSKVSFMNNRGAIIDCSGHGYPQPKLKWMRQDGQILDESYGSQLMQVFDNGSMAFLPFLPYQYDHEVHSTSYRCQLSNRHGTVVSPSVKIEAHIRQNHMPPRVYDEFVIRGNTAVMKCQVPGYANNNVQVTSWLKNDQPIRFSTPPAEDSKHVLAPNGNLLIASVNEEDGNAVFKCQTKHLLQNTVQTSDQGGKLHVTDTENGMSPVVSGTVSRLFVEVGKDVIMPCAAQGKPPPSYSWKKKNGGASRRSLSDHKLNSGSLYIPKVGFSDQGKYECQAKNAIGSDQKTTELLVTDALHAYIIPEHQILNIGQRLLMNCSVSGQPVSKISWFKDGIPLEASEKILEIEDTSMESIGSYQCFVSNDKQVVQASATVFAGDAKPYFTSTFTGSIYSPGAHIEMQCKAKGKPLPLINWTKNGRKILDSRKFDVTSHVDAGVVQSSLRLKNIKTKDGGEYGCTASNIIGNVSHVSKMDVYGPVSVLPMDNATAIVGEDITIKCYVAGYPVKAIEWSKGRRKIRNRRIEVNSDGALKIVKVQSSKDGGRYTCTAIGPDGQKDSQHTWLKVSVKPEIHKVGFLYTFQEDQSTAMTCSVLRGEQPIGIQWVKDGKPLNYDQNIVHSKTSLSSTLQINPLRRSNAGNYTCIARNVAGVDEWTIQVIVQVPPSIDELLPDEWGIIGKDIFLNCPARGNPKPEVEWEYNEDLLADSSKRRIFKNGSLVIKDLQESDAGLYICVANNGVEPQATADVRLFVGEAPVVRSIEKLKSKDKKYIKLVCTVHGLDPVNVKWYLNESPISSSERYMIQLKTFQNQVQSSISFAAADLMPSDAFKCTGANRFGSHVKYYNSKNSDDSIDRTLPFEFEFHPKTNAKPSNLPKIQFESEERLAEMNEAPQMIPRTSRKPKISKGISKPSTKGERQEAKVTFLQILVASVTTAVIILLFVLLLVLIVLWKRRNDKRENQSQYYEGDKASVNNDVDGMSCKDTIDRRYGHLRPKSARSCETLTGSGYYTTISPYATFNPSENSEDVELQQKSLSRRLTDAQTHDF